jgi:site-specific recombinase XerD
LNSASNWTVATQNRYIALLKLTFRLAEKAKKITFNPARLVRQQKENNARIRWLSDSEEVALRAVIQRDCPDRILELEISLHTGMRTSEQYGMEWEFIDFRNRLITIPKSKHGDVRYVRMNSRVADILSVLKDSSIATGSVFASKSPRYWFEPAVKAARLMNFTWHCLRHTFISRLVMAGVDLRTVQELAGHKSIAMTCRYAHLAQGHQQAAVEMLVAPTAPIAATEAERTEKQVVPTLQ